MEKDKFIKRLRWHLAVYFNRSERNLIITVFKDRIYSNNNGGIDSYEMDFTSITPRILAKRIAKEQNKAELISIITNLICDDNFIFFSALLCSLCILKTCVRKAYDYTPFACLSVLIYGFYVCMQIKKFLFSEEKRRVFVYVYALFTVLFESFVLFMALCVQSIIVWQMYDALLNVLCWVVPVCGFLLIFFEKDTLIGVVLSMWIYASAQVLFITRNHHGLINADSNWIMRYVIKTLFVYFITGVMSLATYKTYKHKKQKKTMG